MIPAGLAGIPDLLSDLTGKLAQLVRAEIRLAQAEMADKATAAATAVVPAVIGGLLLIPVLVVLLLAAAEALTDLGMSTTAALLVVGTTGLALAAVLVWAGVQRLSQISAEPHRTVRQIKRDVAMAKRQVEAP